MLFFFGSSRKNVSKREFQEVISTLYRNGFGQRARDEVRLIFMGDLDESDSQAGIDTIELERRMSQLRSRELRHNLTAKQLDTLEEVLTSKL